MDNIPHVIPPLDKVKGKGKNQIIIPHVIPRGDNSARMELKAHLDEIDKRNQDLQSQIVGSKADIKNKKIQLLQKFYSQLQDLGVDPNNLDSISAYLQKLAQTDPDALIVIQIILDALDPSTDDGMNPTDVNSPLTPPTTSDMSGASTLSNAPGIPGLSAIPGVSGTPDMSGAGPVPGSPVGMPDMSGGAISQAVPPTQPTM